MKRFPILRRFPTVTPSNTHSILSSTASLSNQAWAAEEEPLEDYGPTGYYPVAVGDVLGSRYRILRKLGWGVYSTVWLVQQKSNTSQTFGALKLLTGLATDATELHELDYLQRMRDGSPLHPGHAHVLQLLDHFYHHSPNGKHLCLVTEPLAEDMHSFSGRWKNRRIPTGLLKRLTRQIILGLDYLHNVCNIIHTDIKPANIMMATPDNVSTFLATANLGDSIEISTGKSPNGHTISRFRSHAIPYPFPEGDLNDPGIWSKADIRLADVGVACWADKVSEHFTDLIQSPALRAPEVCIGSGWGKAADIWSLGCTVYELAMGQSLIARDVIGESVPYLHTFIFGDYPAEMVKRGKYNDVFFNPDGSLNIPLPQRTSFKKCIFRRGAPPNADVFIDFLQLMLTLDPTKRASCQDLLTHEWLSLEV